MNPAKRNRCQSVRDARSPKRPDPRIPVCPPARGFLLPRRKTKVFVTIRAILLPILEARRIRNRAENRSRVAIRQSLADGIVVDNTNIGSEFAMPRRTLARHANDR